MDDEDPRTHAAGWVARAPVQLSILLFVLLAGVALFPLPLILAPLGFAFVVSLLVFGTVRWPQSFDRLFGVTVPISGWLFASILVASCLVTGLVYTEQYATEAVPFVALTSVCLPWVLALALGGRLRRLAKQQTQLSMWLLTVSVTLAVAAGTVFGWSLPSVFEVVVFAGFVVIAAVVVVVFPLMFAQVRERVDSDDTLDDPPFVSVLVPAYNESKYVGNCIESILASDYPENRMEVIVVDDGSTDETYAEAAAYRGDSVSVYHRSNGGKHAALNFGLSCSRGEVVVAVDADSVLESSAIRTAVARLESDHRLGALAGTVVIDNPDGIVGGVQALEYVLGINTLRRAFSYLGTVMVVPGCLGVFRREAIAGVGGYDPDTVTEDFDLTVRLLKTGWRVELVESVVYTEAPFSVADLLNQRLRWTRGNVQTLFKHRDVLSTPDYGFLHRFTFPLSVMSLLFVPFASIVVTWAILLAILNGGLVGVAIVAGYFLLVVLLVAATALDVADRHWRLIRYAPFHLLGYRQFLDFVVVLTAATLLRGTSVRWESVTRARQQSTETASSRGPAND